jgi:hypothetical protein
MAKVLSQSVNTRVVGVYTQRCRLSHHRFVGDRFWVRLLHHDNIDKHTIER